MPNRRDWQFPKCRNRHCTISNSRGPVSGYTSYFTTRRLQAKPRPSESASGQSRLGGASCRSSHVRNAPLATVGPKKAACRDGPCVDGSELARGIFTSQSWSVQPCVRPLSAVHMTAGHNALRGSGPGQKPAFENALALVGCPDRRIDRLCITCCSPSQPSHHAVVRGAISSDPQRGWIIVSLAPGHHGPGHSGELVG